jgi:hypothetical protein
LIEKPTPIDLGQVRHIFKQNRLRSKLICEPQEMKNQVSTPIVTPTPLAYDAERLTRRAPYQ